jgi:PAS domain S-box-containing protein
MLLMSVMGGHRWSEAALSRRQGENMKTDKSSTYSVQGVKAWIRKKATPISISDSQGPSDKTGQRSKELESLLREREREIEDLKKAQAELQSKYEDLYDQAPVGYITLDSQGRILEGNPICAQLLGLDHPSRLPNQCFRRFVTAESLPAFNVFLQETFSVPGWHSCEVDLLRKPAQPHPVQMEGQACPKTNDCRIVIVDISRRKKAEEEVRSLNAKLEQRVHQSQNQLVVANQELESFSYSVSHDLRAPLRAINGFGQALLEECKEQLGERGHYYLERIMASTQHMGLLIDNLLKLSRVTRSDFKRSRVNLSHMAESLAAELMETAPQRTVEWVIASGIEAEGDENLLEIAMSNLLDNAFKFTARHPTARIEFGVKREHEQPVYFVRDDGAGFDMAYVGKLFGVFQRLHSPSEFQGTGIGLATVQRIVHRHGGHIWVEAQPECGATFYFTLSGGKRDGSS